MFSFLFEKLSKIEQVSNSDDYLENWASISIQGQGCGNVSVFRDLYDIFVEMQLNSALSFFIENTRSQDINDFCDSISQNESWRININKISILNSEIEHSKINIFYSQKHFIEWIKNSNPFCINYFANEHHRCKIFVNGLKQCFGGQNFIVCGSSCEFPTIETLSPNESIIDNHIHIIGSSDYVIKPQNHIITFGEDNEHSRYFIKNSILVLLSCLGNEIYTTGNIVIRGYRRLSINLGTSYDGKDISKKYQDQLNDAVTWIYSESERFDLRLKLLLERISLDIDFSLPYIQGAYSIIEEATIQSKERYSFITYERKDQYHNELKDLLKDVKNITDLFAVKIRGVLSNLLRDVLAAILLIGITQFSKISEISNLFNNKLINYVFFAFGVYFIGSAILQLIVDSVDVYRSYRELRYWKQITREYMTKNEYERHIKNTLLERLYSSIPIYVVIMLIYVSIGIFCFNLPCFWESIVNK